MELRDWIHDKSKIYAMNCAMIGVYIGYTAVTVRNVKNRRQQPSIRLAKSISNYTNGEVSVEELMKGPYTPRGKKPVDTAPTGDHAIGNTTLT